MCTVWFPGVGGGVDCENLVNLGLVSSQKERRTKHCASCSITQRKVKSTSGDGDAGPFASTSTSENSTTRRPFSWPRRHPAVW